MIIRDEPGGMLLIPQTEPGKEFMFSNPFYGELLSAIDEGRYEVGDRLPTEAELCERFDVSPCDGHAAF